MIGDVPTEDDRRAWIDDMLDARRKDGAEDANKGVYEPPYPHGDGDPQYEEENEAYREGFKERRIQLGDKFRWR